MDWKLLIAVAAVVIGMLVIKRASFVSAHMAAKLLQEGALVIDVRSASEFHSRHIPGALNIELSRLKTEMPQRVPDKSKPLLLHCLSGARSGIGRRQLKSMGYINVYNLGSYGRAEGIVKNGESATAEAKAQ